MTAAYFFDDFKYVGAWFYDAYHFVVVRPVTAVRTTSKRVGNKLCKSKDYTASKARAVGNAAAAVAANPAMRATALGATAGGAALGTAGAASGTILGGTAGALA